MADPFGVGTGASASGSVSTISAGTLLPPVDNSLIIATVHSDYKLSNLVGPAGFDYLWFYQSNLGETFQDRQTVATAINPTFTFAPDIGSFTCAAASFAVPPEQPLLQFRGSADAGTAWSGDTFPLPTVDGGLIVVCFGMFDPQNRTSILSVTDNAGNTYYPATSLYRANNGPVSNSSLQIWYAYDIVGRAGHTVLVTLSNVPEGGAGTGLYHYSLAASPSVSVSVSVSPSAETPDVRLIRRLRQTPHLNDEQLGFFITQLQLDLETGRGLTTGQGIDPQIMLQWSDDGGKTWSNEQWVSAGAQGAYRWRAIWRRLGRSRDRVWRIVMSDPVPWRLLDVYGQLEKGTT